MLNSTVSVRAVSALAVALALLGSTAARAQADQSPSATAPSQAAQTKATPAKKSHDDEVVCKTATDTGSRLEGRRTCMTRLQWAQQNREAQDVTSTTQAHSSYTMGHN